MKRDKTGKFIQAWKGESKQAAKLSLTNTAWQLLEQQSRQRDVSRSERVERYVRHRQSHCCSKNKIASSNGKASSLSHAVIVPDTQSPKALLATQIAALRQQNRQLQDHIVKRQQRIEVRRSQEQQLRQIADAIPHRVWTCQTSERQGLEAVLNLLPTPLIRVDPEQQRMTFSHQAANAIAGVDIANNVGVTSSRRSGTADSIY